MNRIFPQFPERAKCPICNTNANEPCILVRVKWIEKNKLSEATPTHVRCLMEQAAPIALDYLDQQDQRASHIFAYWSIHPEWHEPGKQGTDVTEEP